MPGRNDEKKMKKKEKKGKKRKKRKKNNKKIEATSPNLSLPIS